MDIRDIIQINSGDAASVNDIIQINGSEEACQVHN